MEKHVFDKYFYGDRLPHMWCAGCGNGVVLQSLTRAIEKTGIAQDDVVLVAGVGCSSRANGYTDFCGIHTLHGRPIAYATGVKLANPRLKVIVITGDGDCTSIGGNHFIHAARRNIDMTVIGFNNLNYGMTGGQYSSTTPEDAFTKTSQYGNIEPPFDMCKLAEASGATYVARSSTYHVNMLVKQLTEAINHKGFSFVEALCDCPTLYGRLNKKGSAADMMKRWKDVCVTTSAQEEAGKILIGKFKDDANREEYTDRYMKIIEEAKEAK